MFLRIVIFTYISTILTISYAQTNKFAPVGAKWWYDFGNGFFNPHEYYYIEAIEEITLLGKECRRLESSIVHWDSQEKIADFYIYQSNDTVFYFIDSLFGEKIDSAFNVLYIFNSEIGEIWAVNSGDYSGNAMIPCTNPETDFVRVDSIGNEIFEGVVLNKVYFSYENFGPITGWNFSGIAYELLGNTTYLLPIPTCITEDYFPYQLRCYEDLEVGNIQITPTNCDFVTDIDDKINKIKIYPNPTGDVLKIEGNYITDDVIIYSAMGRFIKSVNLKFTTQIDISSLAPGTYYIKFLKNGNTLFFSNFIKQ